LPIEIKKKTRKAISNTKSEKAMSYLNLRNAKLRLER
jgi:hypothetical protein